MAISLTTLIRKYTPGGRRAFTNQDPVNLNAVANGTRLTVVRVVEQPEEVTQITLVKFGAAPSSAGGTITIAIANRDVSAGATDNLLAAATFDLETLSANAESAALTLTATLGDRQLEVGDFIVTTIVSNNADAAALDGLAIRVQTTPMA